MKPEAEKALRQLKGIIKSEIKKEITAALKNVKRNTEKEVLRVWRKNWQEEAF
jgi:hypothetical protein